MKIKKINIYLIVAILTLSVSSFIAAYMLLDEILDSSISLGVNSKTSQFLTSYQQDLKKLKEVDPENQEEYKYRFFQIQDAMVVFKNPHQLSTVIKDSYQTYFLIIFASILFLSLLAAIGLSRKVSNAYHRLLQNNIEKSNRLQQLEYFDNWQHIAASLAHEIKNPLTPIEMMVSNLDTSYHNESKDDFEQRLTLTKQVVLEEVHRLKNMVNHFNQFSRLPEVQLENIDFLEFLQESTLALSASWKNLSIKISTQTKMPVLSIAIDKLLFKQCLLNLVQNAIEANQQQESIQMEFKLKVINQREIEFDVCNRGSKITEKQIKKIFLVGFSTKKNSNRGIGLAIVKKIILDHAGKIDAIPSDTGAIFRITLPLMAN